MKLSVTNNVDVQPATIGERDGFYLRSNGEIAEVVSRVLVEDSTASTRPNADDAVVENGTAAKTATIGDEKWNLDRPH